MEKSGLHKTVQKIPRGKDGSRMKSRKVVAEIGFVFLIGIVTAGCAGTAQEVPQTEEREISLIDEGQEDTGKNTDQEDNEKPNSSEAGETRQDDGEADETKQNEDKTEENADGAETGESGNEQSIGMSEGMEHLGGKVQSTQEDGMIFAQTTLMDEDGSVTLLEVKDAKKIPVKFTADTKVEHWTIQGGGAGIDRKEAALSDLQEGMGVELEGYFEGETFVAVRVMIEVYV